MIHPWPDKGLHRMAMLGSCFGRRPFNERTFLILSTIAQKKIDQFLIGNIFLVCQIFKVFDNFRFNPYCNLRLQFFAVRILDGI